MKILLSFSFLLCSILSLGQKKDSRIQRKDSLIINDTGKIISARISVDSLIRKDSVKRHSPRSAAIRSAIFPGLGQIYNKKYWKVPLVYAAVGIPAYAFFYNKKWYNRTKSAARMLAFPPDTSDFRNRVDPKLYVFFTTPNATGSLLNYRNEFRRNMDYSILFVLLFWGLNVVDATVDAHLRGFDISDDLGLKIKPTFDRGPGLSVVLNFK